MGGGVESGVEEMDLPHSCRCFLFSWSICSIFGLAFSGLSFLISWAAFSVYIVYTCCFLLFIHIERFIRLFELVDLCGLGSLFSII